MKPVAKLVPKGIGAEPKKLAVLGALVVILVVVYLMNRTPSAPESAAPARPQPAAAPAPVAVSRNVPEGSMPAQRAPARGGAVRSSVEDFRPTLKLPEGADVSRIDPTLKLDLLAKVQGVPMEGGVRSLFEFSQPPAPPPPAVKPIKPGPVTAAATPPPPPVTPVDPPKPPPPPIPLKFYGYVNKSSDSGDRRAFFLDGDDIFVAGENDLIRNRYKIIRIGVNSAVVEDTTNKNQQTLRLIEEMPS